MSRFSDVRQGMPSQRQLRVGELVRKDLSDILSRGDVRDPKLEMTVVTVPEVRMSPDLKHATVLVMPLGGIGGEDVVIALQRHAKWLRGQIARRLTLKYMPELHFKLDTRFDDDDRIDRLLHEAGAIGDADGDDTEDGN